MLEAYLHQPIQDQESHRMRLTASGNAGTPAACAAASILAPPSKRMRLLRAAAASID